MGPLKLAIGLVPLTQPTPRVHRWLEDLAELRPYVHDVHFAHYHPMICASGRFTAQSISHDEARDCLLGLIEHNAETTRLPFTLLLNYLLHDNRRMVVENFAEEFYPRGIRSVVIADLDLIKALKDRFPDVTIQGSCLSYRLTEEELAEEAREGVELHNPAVEIVRNSEQLRRNHQAGFKQKIIMFEGCLHRCPAERMPYGHRWLIARNIACTGRADSNRYAYGYYPGCEEKVARDPRQFFRANWITVDRLKELSPWFDVVKLPRGTVGTSPEDHFSIRDFIDLYEHGGTHNVLQYIAVDYCRYLLHTVGFVPSEYFDTAFFERIETCNMQCEQLRCRLCDQLLARIQRHSYRHQLMRRRGRRWRKAVGRAWA